MTYGYGPPPREWRPPVPDDDPDALYYRPEEPPTAPPGHPRHSPVQGQQYEPPTNPWPASPSGPSSPSQPGARRIPQPPPPAKHVAAAGGLPPAQPTYSPTSPAHPTYPPISPAYPTSPPPSPRRPPPNNQGVQPPAYPAFPAPVPTSPTVPRATPPGPAHRPPAPPSRPGVPSAGQGAPPAGLGAPSGLGTPPRGMPAARPGVPMPRAGSPLGRSAAPAKVPRRRGAGKPGAPARRSLPPLPRPRGVTLKEFPGIIRQLPQHKPWMIAIGVIAVAVVAAVCSFGSFMLVKDENAVIGAPPTPETTVVKRDITTRETDPNPMTAADVFPTAEIVADPTIPPYKRMGEVQVAPDCRIGASGEVGKFLVASQCNQVVRATFSTPDTSYFVTGGIFNLPDAETAALFSQDVKGLIDSKQGSITGYISDPKNNVVLGRAPTKVNWEVRGHFVVYTVIVKVDGSKLEPDDPGALVIIYDIMQKYLRDTVLDAWSIEKEPTAGSGSTSPSR